MNKKSLRSRECKDTILISVIVCCIFHGVLATINRYYFIIFFTGALFDYLFFVFPAVLFRYKLRGCLSRWYEGAVAVLFISGIYLTACAILWWVVTTVQNTEYPIGLTVWWGYLILDEWIICASGKEKKRKEPETNKTQDAESDEENGNLLWAEVLYSLPYGLKWNKIKSTDFGAMLKKIYLDNVVKQADKNKMACYVIVAASLAVCEDRARCGRLKSDPPSRIICDCADKITKKMYRKHYINDTTADSLREKTEHWRKILCAK